MGKRITILGLLVIFVLLGYWSVHVPEIAIPAMYLLPAENYDQAILQFKVVQIQEATGLNQLCHSILQSHGKKTTKVIAFVHGYTNCPAQFALLGQQFFDLGYNVLVLRLPQHGLADRMTTELTHFTAQEIISYSDQVNSIASGLGEHQSIVGLSGGGVIAAWMAQTKPLDQAVLIAPGFGLRIFPDPSTTLMTNIILTAPDRFQWWDIVQKDSHGLANAYPRYSWHGLAEQLRLSLVVQRSAQTFAPQTKQIVVITNANDEAVDNNVTTRVVNNWRRNGAHVITYEFPASLGYKHDLIDPNQSSQHTDAIYPVLKKLIAN